MKKINTEPKFKVGDVVEMANHAPKCMFKGIKYKVENVRSKIHPMRSFIPNSDCDCKKCDRISKCPAINAGEVILNSPAVKLEYVEGEIDAFYLKKAN